MRFLSEILLHTSRMKLLVQPLYSAPCPNEEVALEKLKTWWKLVVCLGSEMEENFSMVSASRRMLPSNGKKTTYACWGLRPQTPAASPQECIRPPLGLRPRPRSGRSLGTEPPAGIGAEPQRGSGGGAPSSALAAKSPGSGGGAPSNDVAAKPPRGLGRSPN